MPDAVLLDAAAVDAIRAALDGASVRCRFHGEDFGRSAGWARGEPRCESCRQPYRVQRARSVLGSARRVPASPGVDGEYDGPAVWSRLLAANGPCRCIADPDRACQATCELCLALPDGWPCPALGGYGPGSVVEQQLSEPLDVNGACDRRPTVDGKPACCGGPHRLMCARGRIGVTDGADLAQLQALEQKVTLPVQPSTLIEQNDNGGDAIDEGMLDANEELGGGVTDIGLALGLPRPTPDATWGVPEVLEHAKATTRRLADLETPDAVPSHYLRAFSALKHLVALHDGDRDEVYERNKPKAWVEARAALDHLGDVARGLAAPAGPGTSPADLSEHAATLRWARIVVAADAKAASQDPSAAHELRTLLLRIGRAEQVVRQHRCVAGDRAALVPSIEAMLFAPLTEERTSTLNEALRPLVHQRLLEWAAAVEATDLTNRLSSTAAVDDIVAKVSSGALTVEQAWQRIAPGAPPLAASEDELTLTGDTLGRTTIPAGDPAGPPTLRDLVDPGDAHRAVVATFTEHDVANDDQAIAWWAVRAVVDLQTNHRCATPPLIMGPEAAGYPVGTRLVSLDGEGRPRLRGAVFEVDQHTRRTTFAREVRFLAFPPPPPAPKPLVHLFPAGHSQDEPLRFACCGQTPAEVDQRDQLAFHGKTVTCPGASTPADQSGPDPARAASKDQTAPSAPGASS